MMPLVLRRSGLRCQCLAHDVDERPAGARIGQLRSRGCGLLFLPGITTTHERQDPSCRAASCSCQSDRNARASRNLQKCNSHQKRHKSSTDDAGAHHPYPNISPQLHRAC